MHYYKHIPPLIIGAILAIQPHKPLAEERSATNPIPELKPTESAQVFLCANKCEDQYKECIQANPNEIGSQLRHPCANIRVACVNDCEAHYEYATETRAYDFAKGKRLVSSEKGSVKILYTYDDTRPLFNKIPIAAEAYCEGKLCARAELISFDIASAQAKIKETHYSGEQIIYTGNLVIQADPEVDGKVLSESRISGEKRFEIFHNW